MKTDGDTTLDAFDRSLLALLRENARAPVAELARRLGASRTTTQSRLERLERRGVVAGYAVRMGEAIERGAVRAHIMIILAPRAAAAVEAALRRMPDVRALHAVSGPVDMIAVAATATIAEMDALLDAIGAIEGVERTTSSLILSTRINRV